MKAKIFFLLLIASISCVNKKEQNSEVDKIQSQIENNLVPITQFSNEPIKSTALEQRMKELKVPGVSITISNGKNVVLSKSYGHADVENKKELTNENLLACCSAGKIITAARILQMVDEKRLNLDQNVNNYLSVWKVPENSFTQQEKVTIRRLLEHYSGINGRGGTDFHITDTIPTTVELLNGINTYSEPVEVVRIPGSGYEYSANNYLILQLLITEMDGSFSKSIEENIFEPLGMSNSTYENPHYSSVQDTYAIGYMDNGDPIPNNWFVIPDLAAAGLWTTSYDLTKFISNIQYSLQNQKDGIISYDLIRELKLTDKGSHHLGFIAGPYTFGHPGGCTGYNSIILSWKEQPISAVVIMNGMSTELRKEIIWAIASQLNLPTEEFKPVVYDLKELSDEELQNYTGEYEPLRGKEHGNFLINKNEGKLQFMFSKLQNPTIIRPLNDSIFIDNEGFRHKFIIEDGKVKGFNAYSFLKTIKLKDLVKEN